MLPLEPADNIRAQRRYGFVELFCLCLGGSPGALVVDEVSPAPDSIQDIHCFASRSHGVPQRNNRSLMSPFSARPKPLCRQRESRELQSGVVRNTEPPIRAEPRNASLKSRSTTANSSAISSRVVL